MPYPDDDHDEIDLEAASTRVDNPLSAESLGLTWPESPSAAALRQIEIDRDLKLTQVRQPETQHPPAPGPDYTGLTTTPARLYSNGQPIKTTRTTYTLPGFDNAPPGRIVLHISRIARQRGIVNGTSGPSRGMVNVSHLARVTGLSATTLTDYVRHPERIALMSLDTLARLCGALDCQPTDLLEFVPREGYVAPALPTRVRPVSLPEENWDRNGPWPQQP